MYYILDNCEEKDEKNIYTVTIVIFSRTLNLAF